MGFGACDGFRAFGRVLRLILLVTAGFTTLCSLGGTANARPSGSPDWDAVAECESGQDWSANTGNGYFGGLQFSAGTWMAYGGSGLPHEFSREEQIRVAENVLKAQGLDAWPTCLGSRAARPVPPAEAFSPPVEDDVEPPGPAPCTAVGGDQAIAEGPAPVE
jgi:hypothetical protein